MVTTVVSYGEKNPSSSPKNYTTGFCFLQYKLSLGSRSGMTMNFPDMGALIWVNQRTANRPCGAFLPLNTEPELWF